MNKKAGIWLDRKEAYIVTLSQDSHQLKIIESEADFRLREEGEGKAYTRLGDQYATKEKRKEAKLAQQLKEYYKQLVAALQGVEEVYLFGPAEAKYELHKMLTEHRPPFQVRGVEPCDKLTENQVVAAVKNYFQD